MDREIFGLVVRLICLVILSLTVLHSSRSDASERIRFFGSEIWVELDGSITVAETIIVRSEGQKIKRGIYRDLPTSYQNNSGVIQHFTYAIEGVTRNGSLEDFHKIQEENSLRVYIGDKDTFIPKGRHTYVLTYRVDDQLTQHAIFDELYWNVTGNAWDFPIDKVRAQIHLPKGATLLDVDAYTGPLGAKGADFTIEALPDGLVVRTSRPFATGEGLTVAVSWPKGFVEFSDLEGHFFVRLLSSSVLKVGIIGLFVLILYYLLAWRFVGKDPRPGTIIPLYEPPKGLTPAAARYISQMKCDDRTFAAAIVSLAVKGAITIREESPRIFVLSKSSWRLPKAKPSHGEKLILRTLFGHNLDKFVLKSENHEEISKAKKALCKSLRTEYEAYFCRNNIYFFGFGIIVSLSILAALIITEQNTTTPYDSRFSLQRDLVEPLIGKLSNPVVVASTLIVLAGPLYRTYCWFVEIAHDILKGKFRSAIWSIIIIFLLIIIVRHKDIINLISRTNILDYLFPIFLFATIVTNLVFYDLLKSPTRLGRKMMDRIKGFADYLAVAEKDRMNFHNPPDHTPERFERFLPYALALDVDHAWCRQFKSVLSNAVDYRPSWYLARNLTSEHLGDLSTHLSDALTEVLRNTHRPPESDGLSGLFGGGFSGGGRGGGGGGGW